MLRTAIKRLCAALSLSPRALSRCRKGTRLLCFCVKALVSCLGSCPAAGCHEGLQSVAVPRESWEGPVGRSAKRTYSREHAEAAAHAGLLCHYACHHYSPASCPHARWALPPDPHVHTFTTFFLFILSFLLKPFFPSLFLIK